jgi:hypothetical protein
MSNQGKRISVRATLEVHRDIATEAAELGYDTCSDYVRDALDVGRAMLPSYKAAAERVASGKSPRPRQGTGEFTTPAGKRMEAR